MAIPDEVIDQIKSRLDIVQVVSDHLALKKAGRNWRAVCPFHPDSDPSLVVSPERQTFHCFGCGEGGGPIQFVMRISGLSFPEAVRQLAERVGVEIPESADQSRRRSQRELLLELNKLAAEFYCGRLADERAGRAAREYLERRGVGRDLARRYGLGLAPDAWEGLARYLRGRHADLAAAEALGLIGQSKRGTLVDKFRNRLIIPIHDIQGRIVGFGGRALGADEPKYLNSPDSELYHKGRVLFGLDFAREPIRAAGRAVVVEGYFDALALAAAGLGEAVATCGTALTEDHARLLGRHTERIVLLFDGDAAGRKAAWRTMELFLDKPHQPYVVLLPQEHDPDTFVREYGADRLRALLDGAEPILERFIANRAQEAGQSIEGRVHAGQRIAAVLARVGDPARRVLLAREAATRLGVTEQAIIGQLEQAQASARATARGPATAATPAGAAARPAPSEELLLLKLAAREPALLEEIKDAGLAELLIDPLMRRALELLTERSAELKQGNAGALIDTVQDQELARALAGAILGELPIDQDQVRAAYYDCERKIRLANLRGRAKAITEELSRVAGSGERANELIRAKIDLDRRIREVESGEINAFSE